MASPIDKHCPKPTNSTLFSLQHNKILSICTGTKMIEHKQLQYNKNMQKQLIQFAYMCDIPKSKFASVSLSYLYQKYSSSQNYYHTVLIANITERKYKHESIVFEDVQSYGNCGQYLKRSYKKMEYENKYSAFKQYYFYHEDCPRIFGNRRVADIYETWHEKKRDLVYKKLNIFDEAQSSLQSTMKPQERTKNQINKSNFLLNISQYNPKSNKYYLKNVSNFCGNFKRNRMETNQSIKLCKNMNKQLSRMLMQMNNDLSNISNMNLTMKSEQDGIESQWDCILLGNGNGQKNEIQFNSHGRSQSHSINEANAQKEKIKIIMPRFGQERKEKDFNVTKKYFPNNKQLKQQSKSKLSKDICSNMNKKDTKFDILEQNYDDLRSSNRTQQGKVKSILLISDNNRLNKNFSQKYTHSNQPKYDSHNNNIKNYQNINKVTQEVKVENHLKRSESFSPRKSCFKEQRIVNQVSSVKKIKFSHQQNALNRSPGKGSFIQKLPAGRNGMNKNAIAKNTEILEPINKVKQANRGPPGLTQNNRQLSLNKKQLGVQEFSDTRIANDFHSYKSEFLPPSKSLATLRPSQDFNPQNKLTIKLKSKDLKLDKRNFEKQKGVKSPRKEVKESERKINFNVPSLGNRYFNK